MAPEHTSLSREKPMAKTPRDNFDREIANVASLADNGIIEADVEAILYLADAMDPNLTHQKLRDIDREVAETSLGTGALRLRCLRVLARDSNIDLVTANADEVNDVIDHMRDVEGKMESTLVQYQISARHLYRFHDFGVEPSDINIYSPASEPKHDAQDLFTSGEVEQLRKACGQSRNTYRNRAFLELLIFTGQRITALLTLKIGDVDLDPETNKHSAYIYLNKEYAETYGGLKNALVRGRKRPIFGARKYVRDWIRNHPNGDDPDEWLFVSSKNVHNSIAGNHWSRSAAYGQLSRLADSVDLNKPVNPNNFRHYTATILNREYDVDFDDIRMLLGHKEDSTILEEIYSHLTEDDHIDNIESAMGFADAEESQSFTPQVCPTCSEIMEDDWRQCPYCAELFGPANAVEEAVEEGKKEAVDTALTEDLSAEEQAALRALLDIIDDNPSVLTESLSEYGSDPSGVGS
jgi:integrase/recombinase XerD